MENCKMSKEYRRESDQELLEKLQVLAEATGSSAETEPRFLLLMN